MKNRGENQKPIKKVQVISKIISVLYYILASICAIFLLYVLVDLISSDYMPNHELSILGFTVAIIFSGGFSALFFFMGRGLWRNENWARIVTITFSILSIIWFILIITIGTAVFKYIGFSSTRGLGKILLSSIIPSISLILVNGFIAGYLLFNKKAKEIFQKN